MQDSAGPHLVLSDAQRGTETGRYQGTYGYYWSSSAYTGATDAYSLDLRGDRSAVDPVHITLKRYGFTLHCLGKKGMTTLKSFRLPIGGPSGEYQTLYNNYNSYTAMTNTTGPQFVLSGARGNTSPIYQGTYGFYWPSSAYTIATNAYSLRLYDTTSTVYPAHNGGKSYGYTLRCLEICLLSTQYTSLKQVRMAASSNCPNY